MKKIIFILTVSVCGTMFSQINLVKPADVSTLNGQSNAFIDASTYYDPVNSADNNIGKGLIFPQVDLTSFEFDLTNPRKRTLPTFYDGMIVYNTGKGQTVTEVSKGGVQVTVDKGFYYFFNPDGRVNKNVDKGKWIKIADTNELVAGVNNGKFWTLKGNSGTNATVDYLGTTDAQNLVMKVNVDKEGLDGLEGADDYNPTKLILGNAVDAPAFTKVVIGGTPDEQKAALDTRIKNVQPDGQKEAANFKFVLEVFGKARFANGLVTSASTYPDYVFDNYFTGKSDVNPDYKFKKLNEVEAFIKENNHLPGVTKIDDLAKTESGYEVDNTQLSIQTLEKVEELYLHLIEQQKEIQALKAQIAELKK